MSLFIGCDSSDKRYFAGCPSTTVAIMLFAAPIGIIDLDITGKRFAVVAFFHDLLEFMFHQQRCVIGNTECS